MTSPAAAPRQRTEPELLEAVYTGVRYASDAAGELTRFPFDEKRSRLNDLLVAADEIMTELYGAKAALHE